MAQFQDGDSRVINGVTYVRQNGQWLPTQAQQAAASPFMDPRVIPQAQKAGNEAVASQYAPATAGAEARIKQAEAANAIPLANAQTAKAIADAKAAQAQADLAAQGGPRIDAAVRQKAIQQYNYGKQLQDAIDELNQLYVAGPGATHGLEGLKDYLPYTQNQAFDTKANSARGIVGQTLGFTGGQLNTEREAEKAVGPYLPQSSDRDSVILQKIATLQQLAKGGQENAIQTLGGIPDANGQVHPVQPQEPAPQIDPNAQQSADNMQQSAGGKMRDEIDPVLKGIGQKVGAMIASGQPDGAIIKFLQDNGVNPANTNVGKALQFRRTKDFGTWQRQNPGQPYPVGPEFYTKQVPMSAGRDLFNRAANTNLGGSAAAGIVAAGEGVTGGHLDKMMGPNGQIGMEILRGNHPISSFAGDLAGQALVEGLAGTVPGGQVLLNSRWGRRGFDAAYGAYENSNGDDPTTGGAEGAVTNALGGMFGRGLTRGLGRAATGVKNAHLQYLNNEGVPLTIGQIARGSENTLGHAVGGIEERMAGLPVADAIIGSARKRGDQAFNEAAFRQMGAQGTGAAGLRSGQQVVNDAYSFLDPLHIPTDVPFEKAQNAIRGNLPNLPAFSKEVGIGLDQIDNVSANGGLSGRDWQSALRNVKADRSSIAGQPFARPAADAMTGVENNLVDLANRQVTGAPAGQLGRANKLNAQLQTLAAALDNGPAQKADELFSASGLDNASRMNARNFGGRIKSLTGNRPFYDLANAGKAVMPNLTPDSGTAGRALLYSTLGLGGLGSGIGALSSDDHAEGSIEGGAKGLALASLLAAPYSKTGQKALQKVLLGERPKALSEFGKMLINNPRLGGMFGSAVGRDYFLQPELYLNQ
jgi:hypothetical protein